MQRTPKLLTSTVQRFSCPEAESFFNDLKSEGYTNQVTKQEYAQITRCSVSAVDNYIAKAYGIPQYRKIGHQKNARVLFSLRDVAEYLASQTIKMS